jgi:hypothetical protein
MSMIVKALDQHTVKTIGEKGHVQLGWSNDIKQKIGQLYFQLVRSKDHSDLVSQWTKIVSSFKGKETEDIELFRMVMKFPAHVRDVKAGKGEQQLALMLLYEMYSFYPQIAKLTFRKFIYMGQEEHCLGSFKDIKYFCNYIKERSDANHEFINYILLICVNILKADEQKYKKGDRISLFGKWFPRSKSKKFGWIERIFSQMYYSHIMGTVKTPSQKVRAERKCSMNLRKLLSKLNKRLETTQINMANGTWADINFNKVTGPTLRVHKKAFQNITKNGVTRSSSDDRIACANNFKNHVEEGIKGNVVVKGKMVDMYKLVKDACSASSQTEIDLVNGQWKDNSSINDDHTCNIIPMSDTSGSMEIDDNIPMYNSIGYGIRVSEKTHPNFRHRIMTFNDQPAWFQFNEHMTFYEKVQIMKNDTRWGGSTNFYKALEMILDVIVENEIPHTDVEKLVLAIFSDMQIDLAMRGINMTTMMENIKLLFNEAGLKTRWRKPYPVPHILFWNLRKTSGFPNCVYEKNTSMISGYSPIMLNTFSNKGFEELKKLTPLAIISDIISNSRYQFINNHIDKNY